MVCRAGAVDVCWHPDSMCMPDVGSDGAQQWPVNTVMVVGTAIVLLNKWLASHKPPR